MVLLASELTASQFIWFAFARWSTFARLCARSTEIEILSEVEERSAGALVVYKNYHEFNQSDNLPSDSKISHIASAIRQYYGFGSV